MYLGSAIGAKMPGRVTVNYHTFGCSQNESSHNVLSVCFIRSYVAGMNRAAEECIKVSTLLLTLVL